MPQEEMGEVLDKYQLTKTVTIPSTTRKLCQEHGK